MTAPAGAREAFVGFDSAWGGRAPGGVAWATFTAGRLGECVEPRLARFDDAARTIETLRAEHDYVLVAIDQPTVVPNETGQRPVDGVARALHPHTIPANRGAAALFGPAAPIWWFLDRIDARENPPAARAAQRGLHLIEVFPALALPALEPAILERRRPAAYNPRRNRFSLDDWRLVARAVERRAAALGVEPLSRWAARTAAAPAPDKADQDRLDAAICLLVALEWRRAPRGRMAVIGDAGAGYMVTPVSVESRAMLERAAAQAGAPIDAPWPRDARPLPAAGVKPEPPASAAGSASREIGPADPPPARLRRRLVEAARKGETLTYREAAARLGLRWPSDASAGALFAILNQVGAENRRRGEPLLSALVVNAGSGMPGKGFFSGVDPKRRSPDERRAAHEAALNAARTFDWPD